jgi:acyl-CoA synthetase (NDP forming)
MSKSDIPVSNPALSAAGAGPNHCAVQSSGASAQQETETISAMNALTDTRSGLAAMHRLDPLLKPSSIALMGASARPNSNGLALVEMCGIDGYEGRIYPVNPRYAEISGRKCYPSLESLPERVDHVVIALANTQIESGLELAIAHGAKAATIFGSTQLEGDTEPRLAERVRRRARSAGLALCGGNSMGFYNPLIGLRVAGFPSPPGLRRGGIAFIAQSGSAFSALAHNDRRLGFSLCVSSGMELTATAADYTEWALHQPETRVIGLFLEQVRDPSRFTAVLEAANRLDVPVVILKVGRTARSAAMALSHTGALAGNDLAFMALCRRHGVVVVDDLDEMAATLLFFDQRHRMPKGKLATIHDSGGEREMIVDMADRLGVPFAEITDATRKAIAPHLEAGLAAENPLDAWGTAQDFVARYTAAFGALVEDPNVAAGVFFSDIREGYWYSMGVIEAVRAVAKRATKPVVIATNYSKTFNHDFAHELAEDGIPVLEGTRESLLAIRHAFRWRDRVRARVAPRSKIGPEIVERWRKQLAGAGSLSELQGYGLLQDFGIPVVASRMVSTAAEARDAAGALGYPVVLKTAAGHAHKSDVGGVHLGLATAAAVEAAYADLSARLGPTVLVSAMAPAGVEIGLGAVVDEVFGPTVVVSAGGVLIELIEDKAAALAPFGPDEASELLSETRIHKLLSGIRGRPPVNMEALAELISRFSMMVAALADVLAEIDVNPVIASPAGAVAVDALVITKQRKV